jgi:hypothetical protein
MAPKVTPKQLEILIYLYRFRFLNRSHVQQLLHHKDPKTINVWLKDLTDKKIIGRHYSTKLKENTKPAIYYLVAKSRQVITGESGVDEILLKKRIYREKTRSQRFINHCLTLADFYLKLLYASGKEKLHFFTKTDLSTHYYLPYNRPDAYIAKEKAGKIKRYFLEIIDEGTPRFILRKRIEQFIEYYDSVRWQEETGHPFPSVLLLCPNEEMKIFLQKHISQKLEEEIQAEIDFYLTTTGSNMWVNALEDTETTPEN